MLAGESLLQPLQHWNDTWCDPIVRAMYEADRTAAETALQNARHQLAQAREFNEDQRQALTISLHYIEYRMEKAVGGPCCAATHFLDTQRMLAGATVGPVSSAMQCKLLLMLNSSGERAGYSPFTEESFGRQFHGVPSGDRDQEFWYYVASWAFNHRNTEYLELAYEDFLTRADDVLSESLFRRVHLMHMLLNHRARRQDLEELIRRSKLSQQLMEFRRHIWPVCKEQGLVDEALEHMLTAKEAELNSAGGVDAVFGNNHHAEWRCCIY
jgi:hypothetical protein